MPIIMSSALSAISPSAVALALPVLLVNPSPSDNANTATLVSGSFAVNTGDFLAVATLSRDGNASTHDTLAATGFTCTFTNRKTAVSAGTNVMRVTFWTGIVSAGGTGTLTLTASAAQFQQAMMPLRIPGATAFDTAGGNANETGNTLVVTPDATPDSGALSMVAYAQDAAGGTGFTLADHADITPAASVTSGDLVCVFAAKLGTPPATWSMSGLISGEKAAVGMTVL
jgi:predicted RecA/RadA family phage recombinase